MSTLLDTIHQGQAQTYILAGPSKAASTVYDQAQ